MKFSALKLSGDTLTVLSELGFEEMTPIQAEAISALLSGKDVIGQSKTGSGKTVAFSLPLLEKIDPENRHLQALVLCPTRELCTQVAREIRRLGRRQAALQVLIVCGGQPMGPQLTGLRMGAQIIVATPGRLVDVFMRARPDLEDLKTLVLDEADRMLEMGFEADMELIMNELPKTRQTALFSATYPATIQSLSRKFQIQPVRIEIKDDENSKASIGQSYYEAEPEEKPRLLARVLRRLDPESAIIFCNLKITTTDLAASLQKDGFSAAALNGDLEQQDRDEVLAKFRNGSLRFLIATDVAARGLDIQDLPLVINYEIPQEPEVYVHRIGRTGRAGQSGTAISLISAFEKIRLTEIQLSTGSKLELASLPPKVDASTEPRLAKMQTLFIGGGRKDKVRPGDLLGALTGEAGGLSASEVGKIEIHDHFAYVAIARSVATQIFRKLANGRIKGRKFTVKLLD
ncbi:MAG: ATP-dependent RNA helicase DbpA [Bdellovibrionaceae bacterium]|nr:ATP-dependent RNA helicase DbpA [Pseudobdellovibrionaceae bacterium]